MFKENKKKHRRVRFGTRRCEEGWKPIVYIGEAPISYAPLQTKGEARREARKRAAILSEAGHQH